MAGQRGDPPGGGAPRRRHAGRAGTGVAPSAPREGGSDPAPATVVHGPPAVLTSQALREALEVAGRGDSLVEEVGALRVVLLRLLAERSDDPADLAATIPRVVNATVRALQARRALAGGVEGDLGATLAGVLREMGLGE